MDFGLSETQEMVRSSAREFLRARDSAELARRAHSDPAANTALWQEVTSLGWPGLTVDETFGGSGLGFDDLCVLLEECAAALAPGPLFEATVLGASLISEFGSDELKARILPQVAEGAALVTLAHLERSGRWGEGLMTTATPTAGDAWRLSGEKRYVPAGSMATHFVVSGKTESGQTVCGLLGADATGVEVTQLKVASGEPYAAVKFTSAVVSAGDVLGTPDDGGRAIQYGQLRGAVARASQMSAAADAVVRRTVRYVSERKQFGRAIGSFQAIQHRLADMATMARSSRHLARSAAWSIASGDEYGIQVARAKGFASEHMPAVCWDAHQCHGAIGFTWEHDLHLFTRRVLSWRAEYGDSSYWKQMAAAELLRA